MKNNPWNNVLIVDDEPAQRLLLRLSLEETGCSVVEAANGMEALKIRQENPALRLIVTDLLMPEMDGYELIKNLRKFEENYTYILVQSSLDEKNSVFKALSLGADDYIAKPIWPEELRLRLAGGRRLLQLESRDNLIFSMAKLSEYRSEETGYHLDRVKLYTKILTRNIATNHPELEISEMEINEIAQVSTLHDIGKVAIPDNILHKPGKLSEEEFEYMKRHTSIGGNLLREMHNQSGSPFQMIAFQIALYHHERWDGKGYPEGLAGNEIPLPARIMALADVYDAITSKRSYKDALSHDKTKKIIVEGEGTQFDPKVVKAFLEEEKAFIEIKKQYQDE